MVHAQPVSSVKALMYVRIVAIENDLRRLLADHVLPYMNIEQALGVYCRKAMERSADDDTSAPTDEELLFYLDLGDTISLLNAHKAFLPTESQHGLREVNSDLNRLVPIRNRVMHGRPLLEDDPDVENSIAKSIDESGLAAAEIQAIQRRIRLNPDWKPATITSGRPDPLVIHNLPTPDFDETGLIGRDHTKRRVHNLLTSGRDRVVTLVGEGGVGKTALAIQVLYDLAFDSDCPYEAILWASLKTESLTGEGITKLKEAGGVVLELPSLLGSAIDDESQLSWDELAEALEGTKTLVAVDNVETADADEILDIYDSLPAQTQFLFTSRRGLGQVERRINIESLRLEDADRLLRLFSRRRGLEELAQLPREHVTRIVEELRRMPLGIKWFVMAIMAGAQPEEVLHKQDILLEFCVQNVIDSLSLDAQRVAETLFATAGPMAFSELAVILDMQSDDLRDAIHQLQQSALIVANTQPGASIQYSYALTDSAFKYFRVVRPPLQSEVEDVRERASEIRRSEERRRIDEMRRSLSPNMVYTRDDFDTSAAYLLRSALGSSRRGDLDGALSDIARARDLAPGFFEVPRVEAFIHASSGEAAAASMAYENALELAQDDEQRAIVSYYYGGHCARNLHDATRAESLYRFSHEVLDQAETALTFGRTLTYVHQFDEAEDYLRRSAEELEGRGRLIALTDWVALKQRHAAAIRETDHNPKRAAVIALEGVRIAQSEIERGSVDFKLNETILDCVTELLKALCAGAVAKSIEPSQVDEALEPVTALTSSWREAWQPLRGWSQFVREVEHLSTVHPSVSRILSLAIGNESSDAGQHPLDIDGPRSVGTIKFFDPNRRFGFVTDYSGSDFFFHVSSLAGDFHPVMIRSQLAVTFSVEQQEKGPAATRLRLSSREDSSSLLRGRVGRVERLEDSFGFISDRDSGQEVYFNKQSLGQVSRWLSVSEGDVASFDVEISDRGPGVARGSLEFLV